jgi:hypothetical protein
MSASFSREPAAELGVALSDTTRYPFQHRHIVSAFPTWVLRLGHAGGACVCSSSGQGVAISTDNDPKSAAPCQEKIMLFSNAGPVTYNSSGR